MYTLVVDDIKIPLPNDGSVLRLGRSPENNIVCHDHAASRRHAEIRPERGKLEIRDLGSTNGTLIDGHRISAKAWYRLRPGQKIQIGEYVMMVELSEGVDASEMAPDVKALPGEQVATEAESVQMPKIPRSGPNWTRLGQTKIKQGAEVDSGEPAAGAVESPEPAAPQSEPMPGPVSPPPPPVTEPEPASAQAVAPPPPPPPQTEPEPPQSEPLPPPPQTEPEPVPPPPQTELEPEPEPEPVPAPPLTEPEPPPPPSTELEPPAPPQTEPEPVPVPPPPPQTEPEASITPPPSTEPELAATEPPVNEPAVQSADFSTPPPAVPEPEPAPEPAPVTEAPPATPSRESSTSLRGAPPAMPARAPKRRARRKARGFEERFKPNVILGDGSFGKVEPVGEGMVKLSKVEKRLFVDEVEGLVMFGKDLHGRRLFGTVTEYTVEEYEKLLDKLSLEREQRS